MDLNASKTEKYHDEKQDAVYALPEQLRQWCLSGQSVSETAHLVKNIIQMVSGSVEIIELGLQRKQYDRIERSWDIFELFSLESYETVVIYEEYRDKFHNREINFLIYL